jgi:microcystin-dependent protein
MAFSNYQNSLVLNQEIVAEGIYPSRMDDPGPAYFTLGAVRTYAFSMRQTGEFDAGGSLASISSNAALFSILGTTYGGNGMQNFGLPDLVGTTIVAASSTTPGGMDFGSASHALLPINMPITQGGSGVSLDNHQPSLAMTALIALQSSDTLPAGAVMYFGGNYAPSGYAVARGQLLFIDDYPDLFSRIGTTYGGDGQTTFALPDLTGRTIVGQGATTYLGQKSGSAELTIATNNLPEGGGGSGTAFSNQQPSIVMNYMIAVTGVFPNRSFTDDKTDIVLGEVMPFAGQLHGNTQWLPADGRLLTISEHEMLFTLLGTTYGGDGITTFALPDLRGKSVIGSGQSNLGTFALGQQIDSISHLTSNDIPDMIVSTGALISNGSSGDDTIYGTVGDNTLNGLDGDDILIGGAGADRLDGGTGSNTASYSTATTGVIASLSNTTDNTGDAAGDVYINIQNLIGSAHNDILEGDGGNNILTGGAGDDIFKLTAGHDTITDFTLSDDLLQHEAFTQATSIEDIIALIDADTPTSWSFNLGPGNSLTLNDINYQDLTLANFAVAPIFAAGSNGSADYTFDEHGSDGVATIAVTDPNGDAVTFSIAGGADALLFSISPSGTLSFTQSPDFEAPGDSDGDNVYTVVIRATDATGLSREQTVNVTVQDINDAPIGAPTAVLTDGTEDTAYSVSAATLLAGFADVDGDTLSVTNLTASDGASVNDNGDGTFTVTPAANFNGALTLSYQVSDGNGGTIAATRNLSYTAVNDAPSGAPTAVLSDGAEDTAYSVSAATLLAGFADLDGDTLSVADLTASDGATVTDNGDGTFTVTPAANFNGALTLSYQVSDGNGGTIAATRNLSFTAVNDAPTGTPTAVLTDGTEDTAYSVSAATLLAGFADLDGDTLSVTDLTASNGATVTDNGDGTFTVTPAANFNGALTLSYQVSDGNGGTTAATRNLSFTAVNDAPTGAPTAVLTDGTEDTAYSVSAATLLAGFADLDGDTMSVMELTASNGATVTDNGDGTFTVTPAPDFSGALTLSYLVTDGYGGTTAATRNLYFNAATDAPQGADKTITIAEDTQYRFKASDFGFSDTDGDTFAQLVLTTLPQAGVLKLAGRAVAAGQEIDFSDLGRLVWKPAKDANGDAIAELGFKVRDTGDAQSGTGNLDLQERVITFDVTEVVDRFMGSKKNDKLVGTDGDDVLRGKKGNDVLTGNDGSDTFIFKRGDGRDRIRDFETDGADHDVINLIGFKKITDLDDLLTNHATQKGMHTLLTLDRGDQILLRNVDLDSLEARHFNL